VTDELVPLTDEEHQAMVESVSPASELLVAGEEGEMPVLVIEDLKVGRPAPPLEDYVKANVDACIEAMERDGLKNPIVNGADRIQRAEAYARWRWQGYVDGLVDSL
jgi:hypothetical protein